MSNGTGPLEGWHVRKDVNVGHIVTTVAMIIAASMGYSELKASSADQERRLERLETRAEADDTAAELAALRAILIRIERRLDRFEDRVNDRED